MIETFSYYITIGLFFAAACIAGWVAANAFGGYFKEYESTFSETTSSTMTDMFMFVDPARLFMLNIVGIILVPLLLWIITGDKTVAVAALVGMFLLPWWIYKMLKQRRLKKFESQLPDAFMMISSSLQSGASLTMALEGLVKEQPAPLSQEFGLLIRQQRIGVDFEQALTNMEIRLPVPDFQIAVSAIKIAREVGGNLIEVMESLADTLRRKATMEGKIDSLTSQGRMQGKVMTGLPILLGLILMQIEPEAMSKLFTTPIGWGTLAVIIVMEVLGYLTINKITSIDV